MLVISCTSILYYQKSSRLEFEGDVPKLPPELLAWLRSSLGRVLNRPRYVREQVLETADGLAHINDLESKGRLLSDDARMLRDGLRASLGMRGLNPTCPVNPIEIMETDQKPKYLTNNAEQKLLASPTCPKDISDGRNY